VALYFLGRIYSPTDFGQLEFILKLSGVFIVIAGLRYEMAIVVEEDPQKAQNLTQLSLVLVGITVLLLTLFISLFKNTIADIFNLKEANLLYFAPAIIGLSSGIETLVWWHNRSTAYKTISVQRVSTSIASTTYKLSHPFVKVFSGNGLLIGHVLGLVAGFLIYLKDIPKSLGVISYAQLQAVAKKYSSFPKLSMPASLVNILATSMPVFLLSAFDSQEATGYFGNAYKLTYLPLSMLGMALSQVFFERIARLKSKSEEVQSLSHQLLNFAFALILLPGLAMLIWGDKITPFLLGDQWEEAGIYAQIIIVFFIAMFITSIFSVAFETYQKLKVQLVYNGLFLLFTTGAMVLAFTLGYDTRTALLWFAIVGTIMRLGILNYFFVLFGKPIYGKTLLGLAIFAVIGIIGLYFRGIF
jgi:lipopolysaccharide exporter